MTLLPRRDANSLISEPALPLSSPMYDTVFSIYDHESFHPLVTAEQKTRRVEIENKTYYLLLDIYMIIIFDKMPTPQEEKGFLNVMQWIESQVEKRVAIRFNVLREKLQKNSMLEEGRESGESQDVQITIEAPNTEMEDAQGLAALTGDPGDPDELELKTHIQKPRPQQWRRTQSANYFTIVI